ncbi:MAG: hypothetical protein QXU97_03110 [Fervidicoccaceae archaeon]
MRAALVVFSLRGETEISSLPRRGFASASRRLDIAIRVSYYILTNRYLVRRLKPRISIVIGEPPRRPLHLMLREDFWEDFAGATEVEALGYFRDSVAGRRRVNRLREGLYEALSRYVHSGYRVVVLRERGARIAPQEFRSLGDPVFVVGSDADPPDWVERYFKGSINISLGSRSYLTLHAALFALLCCASWEDYVLIPRRLSRTSLALR